MSANNSDRSEQGRAGKAKGVLPESIRQLIQLQERSPVPFAVSGSSGTFIECNRAFCDLIGYGMDELRSMAWQDLTPPGARPCKPVNPQETGLMPGYGTECVRKDGTRVPVEIFWGQMTDDRGQQLACYVYVMDVSDQKRNEAWLTAMLELNEIVERPLKQIVNHAMEKAISLTGSKIGFVGMISEDGKFMIVQNYSRQAMRECLVRENPLVFPIEKGGIWTDSIITGKPSIVNDYGMPHASKRGIPAGHVPLHRLINIPMVENGRVVAQIMLGNKAEPYDMSDVRHLELLMGGIWRIIQRKNTEKALIESRKQADLYVDLMGHDISNINQIVLGYLEIAREMPDLDETGREYLDRPIEALGRSARLIRNVRKLQKLNLKDMPMEIVDLCMVLEKVKQDYTGNKRLVINYTKVPGIMVRANTLLPDVFTNIIDSAIIKAKGGTVEIDISISRVSCGSGWCHRIDITDNGPGIADEYKSSIFGLRGTYVPETEGGSGIGLYLARLLVESYGGQIWVEDRVPDEPTRGSRFVVLLPIVKE